MGISVRATFLSRGIRARISGIPTPEVRNGCTHMDAIDWNTARFTTNIPMRVDSEKLAASIGDGPLWYAL